MRIHLSQKILLIVLLRAVLWWSHRPDNAAFYAFWPFVDRDSSDLVDGLYSSFPAPPGWSSDHCGNVWLHSFCHKYTEGKNCFIGPLVIQRPVSQIQVFILGNFSLSWLDDYVYPSRGSSCKWPQFRSPHLFAVLLSICKCIGTSGGSENVIFT